MKAKNYNMTTCHRWFDFDIFITFYGIPLLIVSAITLTIIGFSALIVTLIT